MKKMLSILCLIVFGFSFANSYDVKPTSHTAGNKNFLSPYPWDRFRSAVKPALYCNYVDRYWYWYDPNDEQPWTIDDPQSLFTGSYQDPCDELIRVENALSIQGWYSTMYYSGERDNLIEVGSASLPGYDANFYIYKY